MKGKLISVIVATAYFQVAFAANCGNPLCGEELSPNAKGCKFCGWRVPSAPQVKLSTAPRKPVYNPTSNRTPYTSSPSHKITPLKLGLVGSASLPSGSEWDVMGLQVSALVGDRHNVCGLSLAGITDLGKDLTGLSLGVFSSYDSVCGVQLAAFVNQVTQKMRGVQLGVVNNAPVDTIGVQIGVFNTIGAGSYSSSRTLPIINMKF